MTSESARRRFRETVVPHLDDSYSLAKWLSGNASDAEDIVQDAALRALVALERGFVDNPRAWFLKITRNAALTWMARNRPKTLSFAGDLTDLESWEDPSRLEAPPDAEQSLIAAERSEQVRRAIADLPSPFRETLVMRDINGLNYREIADATEAPIGTVMSRLSRARAVIAKALGASASTNPWTRKRDSRSRPRSTANLTPPTRWRSSAKWPKIPICARPLNGSPPLGTRCAHSRRRKARRTLCARGFWPWSRSRPWSALAGAPLSGRLWPWPPLWRRSPC